MHENLASEANGAEPEFDRRPAGYGPLWAFVGALLALAALKVGLAYLAVPLGIIKLAEILITIVFVAVPVYALYRAAAIRWSVKLGLGMVVLGVLVHVGLQVLGRQVLGTWDVGGKILLALRDLGLFAWCVGLGATLASILRDRNLLIPVSIFLAGFDVFLVLTPIGPVKQILKAAPDLPQQLFLNIPAATAQPTTGAPVPFAFIGPADFVFMAMFFIALFRFGMNVRTTAVWLAPAILAYLGLSLLVGAIPLLVPIGLTVLIVNWKQFRLNAEEWGSTALIALLVGGAIWWGATRPAPPTGPSLSGAGPDASESAGSPGPGQPDRSP